VPADRSCRSDTRARPFNESTAFVGSPDFVQPDKAVQGLLDVNIRLPPVGFQNSCVEPVVELSQD
jgi:hypothetical protein